MVEEVIFGGPAHAVPPEDQTMFESQLLDQPRKERAKDLLNQGRLEEARALLVELCREDQRDTEIWSLYIAANGFLGRFADVIEAAEKTLQLEPDHLPTLNSLASAFAASQRYDEAATQFARLMQLAPDNPAILNNYGHTLFLMGRLDDARATLENAVRIQPYYAEAHYNLGILLEHCGFPEDALFAYEQAIALKPGLPGLGERISRLRQRAPSA